MSDANTGAAVSWYKDPQWWRDKWPDLLFGLIGAGAGGYALVLLGQIGEMAAAYPKALAAFGLVSFSAGALLGSSRRRHEREMEHLRREEDRRDRMEAERRAEEHRNAALEVEARAWVMGLDPDQKLILMDLSLKGSWVTDYMNPSDFRDYMLPLRRGIESTRVDADWRRYYAYRLSLTDFGELAVRVGTDMLEDVARIRAKREEVEGAI